MDNKGKKNKVSTVNTKFLLIAGGAAVFLVIILSTALIAFYGARGYTTGEVVAARTGEASAVGDFSDEFDIDIMSMEDMPPLPMIPFLDETVVATVNGVGISARDVGFRLREAEHMLSGEYLTMFPDDWDFDYNREFRNGATFGQAVREEAARRTALHILYEQYAAQYGIALTDDDMLMISQELEMMEMQFAEEFEDMLRADGIQNPAHLESLFIAYTLMDHVMMSIIDDPAKFAAFEHLLEAAEETEIEEELLGAKHILANFDHFDSPEEAEAFAEALLVRALAGEDFDMLVREYGQDPGMEFNPEGYTFTSGAMVPEFEDATRALAIGEISGLVPSGFGIHIIKRVEPNPDGDVMRPWGAPQPPTLEQRMAGAILDGFEAKLADADIVFHVGLNDIPVEW